MTPAAVIAARLEIAAARPRTAPPPAASRHRRRWCPGCGVRPITLRARHCRPCFDGSPEKSRLAAAAARANPRPGGRPRRTPAAPAAEDRS